MWRSSALAAACLVLLYWLSQVLLMAFIALASAAIFISAGGSVAGIWNSASNQLSNAAVTAS